MAWIKFHDDFFTHPRTASLPPAAVGLHVRAICYSNQHMLDGEVPLAVIASWGWPKWRHSMTILLTLGVWTKDEESIHIRDYLDYQRSRSQILETREQRAVAGSKGGKAKAIRARQGKQTASKVLEPGLAEEKRKEPSSSPPVTDTGVAPAGNVNTEDDYTATINHMARCDLERARANGVTIGNEAAWMRATVENRSTNDGEAVRYELSRRNGGKYYPVHIEVAEAVDDKCGPPDGGRARADAKAAETTASRLELEAELAATRADPEATRRGAAAARAALASHPDQGAARPPPTRPPTSCGNSP